jgi:uncharacterized GH25 family protein
MKRLIPTAVLLLAVTATVQAHFVFIVPPTKGGRTVQVVFSDSTKPDSAKLLDKIKNATFQVIDEKGKRTEVKAKKVGSALEIAVPGDGPAEVVGRCVYGVVAKGKEPFLLNYYSRTAIEGNTRLYEQLPAEAKQPLQVVLMEEKPVRSRALRQGEIEGVHIYVGPPRPIRARVLWQGKPLPGAEITFVAGAEVALAGNKPVTAKTDKQGEVKVGVPPGGLVALLARHVEETKGTHDGKKHSSIRHYATLVFNPLSAPSKFNKGNVKGIDPALVEIMVRAIQGKPAADPEATKLLADARAARANWDDFPGFTADVVVNVEGTKSTGKVTVSDKGKVNLDMKGDAKEWARRMISSIVGHRLDDGTTLSTPCAFADDVKDHPMGRAIHVLNDEYHSSYRIRDRQVIEVNRRMGESRFTISVLANRLNADKKYLPASYVVNTWSVKTEALQGSATHHNTWVRVGTFDLPLACTIVNASAGKLVNRTIHFSNHKLAQKKGD